MREHFVSSFLERFAKDRDIQENEDLDNGISELVRMNTTFNERWAAENVCSLTPNIEACADALLQLFHEQVLRPLFAQFPDATVTLVQRSIRRDRDMAPRFASLLQAYVTKTEQDRGGRNANYKSMFNAGAAYNLALHATHQFLVKNREKITKHIKEGSENSFLTPHTIAWDKIARQLPKKSTNYAYKERAPRPRRADGVPVPTLVPATGPPRRLRDPRSSSPPPAP